MQNIIFIVQKNYKDSLVGPQLIELLDHSIYIDGKWCCYCVEEKLNETSYVMALDNIVHFINNALLSKEFSNIIVGWNLLNLSVIEDIITHIQQDDCQFSIFELTTTEGIDVENFELKNKEYQSNYYTLETTGQLVKSSAVDTTDISAFKIAFIISKIILCQ